MRFKTMSQYRRIALLSVSGGGVWRGSCDSQSKSSQYVNLSQANEERKKEKRTEKKD
jgi:hypothetical protein